jgi:hypothetical protein
VSSSFRDAGDFILANTTKTVQGLQELFAQALFNLGAVPFVFDKQVQISGNGQQPLQLTPPDNAPLDFNPPGQQPVQDVQPVTQGDLPNLQGGGGGGGGATIAGSRYVTIKEIHKDTLIVDDPNDVTFRGVVAARPWWIRGSRPKDVEEGGFESISYQGQTYQIRTSTQRTFDDFTVDFHQYVYPFYLVGRPLTIIEAPTAVIDPNSPDLNAQANVLWIDANSDARLWTDIRTGPSLAIAGESPEEVLAILLSYGL